MVPKEAFLKSLRETFKIEAKERLKALSAGILGLEKASGSEVRAGIVEGMLREAHSMKGAARAVNLTDVETISHSLESVFSKLKHNEIDFSRDQFDMLHRVVDAIGEYLESSDAALLTTLNRRVTHLVPAEDISAPASGAQGFQDLAEAQNPEPEVPPQSQGTPSASETTRISVEKLDALVLQAEEMHTIKLRLAQRAADLQEMYTRFGEWGGSWERILSAVRSVRRAVAGEGEQDLGTLAKPLATLLEFIDQGESYVRSYEDQVHAQAAEAEGDRRAATQMVDQLVKDTKQAAMSPVSSFLESFPKLVRDLSRDTGKEVDLEITGENIDVDRRILEEMKDPLVHLLRNAIDHGVEPPEERESRGKPRRGTVTIAVSQVSSRQVKITVADDGAGIDVDAVRTAAQDKGIVSTDGVEQLGEQETLTLIFRSEVTTSTGVTEVSGRGIGLAIVEEKVGELGGTVTVESERQVGTRFLMALPLTVAMSRGILVQTAGQVFVTPAASVERAVRVKREEIRTVGSKETLLLNGDTVPLVWLRDVLELREKGTQDQGDEYLHALVLGVSGRRIAFGVDDILKEQPVLVKGLGKQLARVRNVAGSTVLGSGKLVPILNASDLMKSASKSASHNTPVTSGDVVKKSTLLVVEDSITSRMLLKSILESSGYHVKTAVDGVDAFAQLQSGAFDLVISDVDMPRLNGFDLTAKIRAESEFSELPVVLVTSLNSHDDVERGISVGADAYIVKGSFDEGKLLEIIRRLIKV